MRTDGQRIVGALAAVEGYSVHKTLKVDVCNIALLNGSVFHVHSPCVLSTLPIDLGGDFLLRDINVELAHFHALILAQRHLRLQGHLRGKNEGFAGLQLNHVDLRTGHDLLAALVIGLLVGIRDQLISGILVENLLAVHLLDHLAGHLALAEARDADLVLVLLVSLLNGLLQLLRGHFNR